MLWLLWCCLLAIPVEAFHSIFVKGEMQKLAAEYVSLIALVVAIACFSRRYMCVYSIFLVQSMRKNGFRAKKNGPYLLAPLFYEISFFLHWRNIHRYFHIHLCLKTDRKFLKPGDTDAVLLRSVPVNAPTVLHLCPI